MSNVSEERKSGLRHFLSFSSVYDTFQLLIGGKKARKFVISNFINPTLRKGDKVLDIGCGTGYTLDYFNKEVEYHGYDLDETYIAHAKKKYKNKGTFYCERVSEMDLEESEKFDYVIVMGLLHHLSDKECFDLFRLSNTILKKGGKLVTLDGVFYEGQAKLTRYVLNNDRGKYVRDAKGYKDLAASFFKNVEEEITDDLFTIPYTACIFSFSN